MGILSPFRKSLIMPGSREWAMMMPDLMRVGGDLAREGSDLAYCEEDTGVPCSTCNKIQTATIVFSGIQFDGTDCHHCCLSSVTGNIRTRINTGADLNGTYVLGPFSGSSSICNNETPFSPPNPITQQNFTCAVEDTDGTVVVQLVFLDSIPGWLLVMRGLNMEMFRGSVSSALLCDDDEFTIENDYTGCTAVADGTSIQGFDGSATVALEYVA